jgi:hypothetical protein
MLKLDYFEGELENLYKIRDMKIWPCMYNVTFKRVRATIVA